MPSRSDSCEQAFDTGATSGIEGQAEPMCLASSGSARSRTTHGSPGWGWTTTITSIRTTFGSPSLPGGTPPAGTTFQVAVWDDPNDDGNFSDGVLLPNSVTNAAIAAESIDSNVLQTVAIPATTVDGFYFVGVIIVHTPGYFPAALDTNNVPPACGDIRRSSCPAGSTNGVLDLTHLGANDIPQVTLASAGLFGTWLLRVDCAASNPGTPYCFGDGSETPCPCSNSGTTGRGCANSIQPSGARLTASGSARVSNDSLVLQGSGMPNSSCLYFQGTGARSSSFGDGLRCASGSVSRLGAKSNLDGASAYPAAGENSVSVRGRISAAGATRYYQVWYLDTHEHCTDARFNFSNGLQIVWSP
jgi:hypothetical protein